MRWYIVLPLAVFFVLSLATGLLVENGLDDDLARCDVALVLGNEVRADGTPSPRLKARLDEALLRFHEGWYPLIVVSGGLESRGMDEAFAMKGYLVARGVPAAKVVMDPRGVDTFSSARNLRALLDARRLTSVFVVTQYFHVPRARLALQRFGVTAVHASHPSYFELRDLYAVPREVAAYAWYAVRPTAPEPPYSATVPPR